MGLGDGTVSKMLALNEVQADWNMVADYTFRAEILPEADGSVTIALDEIELAENGTDTNDALQKLACAILEYSEDFYKDFAYWAKGSKLAHIPYVFKALMLNDTEKIKGSITCRHGRT